MLRAPFATLLRSLLLGLTLLLPATAAWAQAAPVAPQGYDFLTITVEYTYSADFARIYFFPAFQGKAEIALEPSYAPGENLTLLNTKNQVRYKEAGRHNAELLNQQLSELTIAGWELTQVWSIKGEPTHYLFRKSRP